MESAYPDHEIFIHTKMMSLYAPPVGMHRIWQGAKTAMRLWSQQSNMDKAAHILKTSLGQLRGPLLKAGQLTAMIPGLLPSSVSDALQDLCAHAPPMGWSFVRRRMMHEMGPMWKDRFSWFSPEPSFAASLGQVHKACFWNETYETAHLVACKLQYPGLDRVIETDLAQLRFFCRIYEHKMKALDTTYLQEELKIRLYEELNYLQECEHMKWFHAMFQTYPNLKKSICIPSPLFCTERLIIMSWVEGKSIQEAIDLPQSLRNELGTLLFKAWYAPFYSHGALHGDPHMGNATWTYEGGVLQLNLLDFGCVRLFPPQFVEGVLKLYRALQTQNLEQAHAAYEQWGFHALSHAQLEALNAWATLLFAPFLLDRGPCLLEEVSSVDRGKMAALHVQSLLKQHGLVKPPKAFLLMDRVAVVLGAVLMRLKVRANWFDLFQEVSASFSLFSCEKAQNTLCSDRN
jgi:predicted unusual protein kinase regulating ubiquinone biosynthesis (AarF/ABC1/UbiB family)